MLELTTSELLAYAKSRLKSHCLDDIERLPLLATADVFYEIDGAMVAMPKNDPKYELQGVTILDRNAWFLCKTKQDIDNAVAAFVESYAADLRRIDARKKRAA